jgi:hypothetical protein
MASLSCAEPCHSSRFVGMEQENALLVWSDGMLCVPSPCGFAEPLKNGDAILLDLLAWSDGVLCAHSPCGFAEPLKNRCLPPGVPTGRPVLAKGKPAGRSPGKEVGCCLSPERTAWPRVCGPSSVRSVMPSLQDSLSFQLVFQGCVAPHSGPPCPSLTQVALSGPGIAAHCICPSLPPWIFLHNIVMIWSLNVPV